MRSTITKLVPTESITMQLTELFLNRSEVTLHMEGGSTYTGNPVGFLDNAAKIRSGIQEDQQVLNLVISSDPYQAVNILTSKIEAY